MGKQNSEMISNNYYEEELEYQKVIDAKKNAAKLENQPTYQVTSEGIQITFPKDAKPDRHHTICADVIRPAYSSDTEHAKKVSKEHHQN